MIRQPLALIWAMDPAGLIGKDGGLPWRIREDLQHFKRTTLGHTIIMGRRTWESLGKVLPGRRNLVVSSSGTLKVPGGRVVHSLDEALAFAAAVSDELPFVIGGVMLYAEALERATRLFLTEVHERHEGDTWFPRWDRSEWREVARAPGVQVDFVELERAAEAAS